MHGRTPAATRRPTSAATSSPTAAKWRARLPIPETFAGTLSNQSLGGGSYYLNNAFNLASLKLPYPGIPCLGGISLAPKFTAPNPVNSGEIVGFDGMESDITLNEGTAYTGHDSKRHLRHL